MDAPSVSENSSPSPHLDASQPKPRNIVAGQRTSFSRPQRPTHQSFFERERENSGGGWSASSVGTGISGPSSSVNRTLSKKLAGGGRPSALGGAGLRKKRDKHSLALLSIREFLKGRSCYDCLPVSFRLVVLDTKLVVKPALDVMWQAGIVSAPLWQSTSQPIPAIDSLSSGPAEDALSPSELSARLAASELVDNSTRTNTSTNTIPPYRSPSSRQLDAQNRNIHSALDAPLNSASPPSKLPEGMPGSKNFKSSSAAAPPPGKAGFAGMLTVNDIIHLIQYYYQHSSYDNAAQDVERFRLEMLREIEQTLHVPQPPLISIEPLRPLFDACQLLIETHARRLPLLDYDEQTGMEAVVSVLTQYRVLKFIAMNCRETAGLNRTLRSLGIGTYVAGTRGIGRSTSMNPATTSARGSVASSSRRSSAAAASNLHSTASVLSGLPGEPTTGLGIGTADMLPPLEEAPTSFNSPAFEANPSFDDVVNSTQNRYHPLATATLDTTVFDVVHVFSEKGISAVPILDEDGDVVDMYETVDVIDLVRSGAYQSLDLTIQQALSKRSKEFPGVMTCGPDDTLATIFTLLRTNRVHRLLILEPELRDELDPFDLGEWQEPGEAVKEKPNDPLAGLGEIKERRKGKLVGILCLSDILRYVIGGKANLLDSSAVAGALSANVNSSLSALGDAEASSVTAEGEEKISTNATSSEEALSETAPIPAPSEGGGQRPVDMPPTIEEHPKELPIESVIIEQGGKDTTTDVSTSTPIHNSTSS